jgi:C4-type Zn-finger protein
MYDADASTSPNSTILIEECVWRNRKIRINTVRPNQRVTGKINGHRITKTHVARSREKRSRIMMSVEI